MLFTGFSFAIRQDFQSTQATIITKLRRIRFVVTVITEKTTITAARNAKPACCKVISISVYFFSNVEPS